MILANFIFGIVIFQEPVHDIVGTAFSFVLLAVGLVGMSRYSSPTTLKNKYSLSTKALQIQEQEEYVTYVPAPHVILCGGRLPLSRRQCGIAGAVVNGIFTGCSLIPLHYAKEEGFGGERYILSMSCGALVANILVWVLFFMTQYASTGSIEEAMRRMPKLYFKTLWKPGFLAGTFLAIAMFGSIFAVTYLGQGIGNSLVQTKILISGLWGICWFKEINGKAQVSKWFASALLTIGAIVWLSMERLQSTSAGTNVEHYS
eukprot:scaffold1807_cov140-Cylindrotheca_fusiformis.AAC.23